LSGAADAEPTPAVVAASNSAFFQVLGVAGLIVGFLCYFMLKEPKGSFDELHEGETAVASPPLV
jgi:MFS transporter, NNP family, nitrate/nitrite transporter